jgi:hypothetical protein
VESFPGLGRGFFYGERRAPSDRASIEILRWPGLRQQKPQKDDTRTRTWGHGHESDFVAETCAIKLIPATQAKTKGKGTGIYDERL